MMQTDVFMSTLPILALGRWILNSLSALNNPCIFQLITSYWITCMLSTYHLFFRCFCSTVSWGVFASGFNGISPREPLAFEIFFIPDSPGHVKQV